MKDEVIHISELTADDKNFNLHTEFGMGLLERSISKFGMGRSILIDKDNKIIAGNGITETAGSVGIEKVRVVETDGTEIIAVKRKDISLDSEQGREMALADNATSSANLQWDYKEIEKEMGAKANEWGVELGKQKNYFNKEEGSDNVLQEFPITILQTQEEYNMFIDISRALGKNNADTFSEILRFYKQYNV